MNKPTRSRVDCFVFPLEAEAVELLSAWESQHRFDFMRVRANFVDLRFDLGNCSRVPKTRKLMRILTYWERLMLADYDKVAYTLVPSLKDGYGTFTTIHDYKGATNSLARYADNHRRLRNCYNKLIEGLLRRK